MRQGLFLRGSAASALLIAGCAKTVNTIDVPHSGAVGTTVTDPHLNRVASLSQIRKGREGNLLRVQADLTNRTDYQQYILARFVWLDDSGLTVDSPLTTWKRHILQGGQTVSLSGVAPDSRVTDCRIELQRTDAE